MPGVLPALGSKARNTAPGVLASPPLRDYPFPSNLCMIIASQVMYLEDPTAGAGATRPLYNALNNNVPNGTGPGKNLYPCNPLTGQYGGSVYDSGTYQVPPSPNPAFASGRLTCASMSGIPAMAWPWSSLSDIYIVSINDVGAGGGPPPGGGDPVLPYCAGMAGTLAFDIELAGPISLNSVALTLQSGLTGDPLGSPYTFTTDVSGINARFTITVQVPFTVDQSLYCWDGTSTPNVMLRFDQCDTLCKGGEASLDDTQNPVEAAFENLAAWGSVYGEALDALENGVLGVAWLATKQVGERVAEAMLTSMEQVGVTGVPVPVGAFRSIGAQPLTEYQTDLMHLILNSGYYSAAMNNPVPAVTNGNLPMCKGSGGYPPQVGTVLQVKKNSTRSKFISFTVPSNYQ